MQKQNRRIIVFLNMMCDMVLILLAYVVSFLLRFYVLHGTINVALTDVLSLRIIFSYSVVVVILYWMAHLYVPVTYMPLRRELFRIFIINLVGAVGFGFLLYVFRITDFSRLALVLFFLISTGLIFTKRIMIHAVARKQRITGSRQIHVVLIGSGKLARQYVKDAKNNPHLGLAVDGYVGNADAEGIGRHFGSIGELESILEKYEPDQVVVALEPSETGYIQSVLEAVEKEGIPVSMVPFYSEFYPSHPRFEILGRTKLINLRATPLDNIALSALKRTVDLVGSALLIILFSPLMLFTAIGVKLSSPGPVFFRQSRIGKDKKPFTMLKFRSMRINAEEKTGWSTAVDPRRTRFGSFIRKYSIDELPQLFNVFIGDMSLVGPRPEVPYYVYQFKETVPRYLIRQQVRPGMTGWAQVHGLRGDTSIEARVDYDIWYIENWSLWLDIRILFLTLLGGFINSETLTERSNKNGRKNPRR